MDYRDNRQGHDLPHHVGQYSSAWCHKGAPEIRHPYVSQLRTVQLAARPAQPFADRVWIGVDPLFRNLSWIAVGLQGQNPAVHVGRVEGNLLEQPGHTRLLQQYAVR